MMSCVETVARASVLIVEDDRVYVEFLATVCNDHGLLATPATSFADAARQLRLRPYDVLVVDLDARDHDGMDLIRRVRNEWPTIPVVGMTTGGRTHSAGAWDYLLKPFHWEELILRIDRAASRRR
jgi:DNA-binding response OmpR family regulator